MRTVFMALMAVFLAAPAFAATSSEPAFRSPVFHALYPWQEGLEISFLPDEGQCRARYGRQWREKCAASLGNPQDVAKNIRLEPATPGYWRWKDGTRLNFVPEGGIRPDTSYTVDFSGLYRSPHIKLDKTRLTLKTPPLSCRLAESTFWTDPSPRGEHRLAAALEFNFPVSGSPETALSDTNGAELGPPTLVWNSARDRLNISWPVKKLPVASTHTRLSLPGFGEFAVKDGRETVAGSGKGGASFRCLLPGRGELFKVRKARLTLEEDAGLDEVHVLELEFSLYVSPAEVLKNLDVWELPPFNSSGADRPYNWLAAPAIPASALEKGRRLVPESLQSDGAACRLRFRLPATPGRYVLCGINENLRSTSGAALGRVWRSVYRAGENSARLDFLQPGHVLPLSGERILDIMAGNIDRMEWEAQLVRDPFLALMAAGQDAFARPLAGTALDMSMVSESARGELAVPPGASGQARFLALDLGQAMEKLAPGKKGALMRVALKGFRQGELAAENARLVLSTDLGIMAKRTPLGAYDVFVHSLSGGRPAGGAMVSILGANGKPVATVSADADGHAAFGSLDGLAAEKRPVAAVATLEGDLAWLPLRDKSRETNFSAFPVGGSLSAAGVQAFVFSQRGIYRPGDTLHFGAIVRQADFSPLPAGTPLVAEISGPRGRVLKRRNMTVGPAGILAADWKSPASAQSGRYVCTVRPAAGGPVFGSATVRMEEFEPETLRLDIGLPAARGWILLDGGDESFSMALKNLYGSPAAGHRVRAGLVVSPAVIRLKGYEDFVFTDAAPLAGHGFERKLPEAVTDAEGRAGFSLPRGLLGQSSATLLVRGEGFEAGGGRACVGQAAALASPLRYMLGYRPRGALGNLNYIPQGLKAELEFLALDHDLKTLGLADLDFRTARIRRVTSLVSDGGGGFRYDESPVEERVSSRKLTLEPGGSRFFLETGEAGEYQLTVMDRQGAVLAKVPYIVAGTSLQGAQGGLAGARLRLSPDRQDYAAGDEIRLAISAPYAGTGLITIERDGVAAWSWFTAQPGENTASIRVPDDFEGRGYVIVSLVRSPGSDDIYMSPHAFAAAPFSANIVRRDMGLEIESPRSVLPGGDIEVTLKSRQPGQAVLFAVDEGVLQLTGFSTPDPIADLLLNRALEVKSIQAFDLVMPEHSRLARRVSAFGGGLSGSAAGSRFQNPFRRRSEPPVAFWSGIVDVGGEGTKIRVPVPDYYNGKIRLMAAGSFAGGAGNAEREVSVRAPIILGPRMPAFVSPGDSFASALVVANTGEKTAALELEAHVSPQLKLLQGLPGTLEIKAGEEMVLPLRFLALDSPGEGVVTFSAKTGKSVYKRSSFLSLRPASALRTTLQTGLSDSSRDIHVPRLVYAVGAESRAVLSVLPVAFAASFGQYLRSYAYGCTEQLVSRAFGALLLRSYEPFRSDGEGRAAAIDSALEAMRARSGGQGLSLWPNGSPDRLLTIYGADFLVSAREAGFDYAADLLAELCDAIEAHASLEEASLAEARRAAYGIWVLTRSGRITSQMLENLQQALLEQGISGWQNDVTALFMAASRAEMKMRPGLPSGFIKRFAINPDGWFDALAQQAACFALLARYFPDQLDASGKQAFFDGVSLAVGQNRFATFSAAQAVRALAALPAGSGERLRGSRLVCADGQGSSESDGGVFVFESRRCEKYRLEADAGTPPLFWQIATTGYDRNPSAPGAEGIAVTRSYEDLDGNPAGKIRLGDIVRVRLTIRPERAGIRDCVVSDLLPGGFEMVLRGETRLPPGARHIDRREDRMLVFADLSDGPLVFTYDIRAVSAGNFTLAPATAEAMYDPSLHGSGGSGTMTVEE